MVTAWIAGSLVVATASCVAKLIAPWVRAHEFHEEVLEIQRELAIPPGQPWSPEVDCTQDLANLAAAILAQRIANSGEVRTVTAPSAGGAQRQQSPIRTARSTDERTAHRTQQ